MKTLIIIMVAASFLATSVPVTAHAGWNVPWDKSKRSTMEKSANKGYSEQQRDYKAKRKRTRKHKEKPGYYNGKYHYKSREYRKGEWQFID